MFIYIFQPMYADIKLEVRDPRKGDYDDADTVLSWSAKRYNHLLKVISLLLSVKCFFSCKYAVYNSPTYNGVLRR